MSQRTTSPRDTSPEGSHTIPSSHRSPHAGGRRARRESIACIDLGRCGWERGRVLIPLRDQAGELRSVLRYAPAHDHAPKMLAARGTQLGLIPHPAAEPSGWIVLVEGPPDMISARSQGLPAIAVPGDDACEPEWARLLADRHVSVVLDCDPAGREAAARIAADLKAAGVRGSIIDPSPAGWIRLDRVAQHARDSHRRGPAPCAWRSPSLRARLRARPAHAGDVAVGESKSARPADGLLILGVGLALALRRARDLPKHIPAQRLPGAQLPGALRVSTSSQRRARRDGGARCIGVGGFW